MPLDRPVGLVFDDRYLTHNTGLALIDSSGLYPFAEPIPHPSSPALVGRAKHLMDLFGVSERMLRLELAPATDEQLTAFHTPDYVQRVAELAATDGGDCGDGSPIGRGGDKVARLAAGGTIAAVEAVMTGQVGSAYALVRPPGHHALADRGMGFCVYNNAVLAVRHAQRVHAAERVLVLDWDVHHGNGTQSAFWTDADVLFISVHQDDLYPVGWGALDQVGGDGAQGFTVNIPLPAGAGNRAYVEVFASIVAPIVREFAPDLIVVSAGQDASVMDPLARMSLTLVGYQAMTETMQSLAAETCDGRLVVTQEGGYAPQYAPYCSATIAQTLVGLAPGEEPIPDPYGERAETQPASIDLGLDAARAIERVIATQRAFWPL